MVSRGADFPTTPRTTTPSSRRQTRVETGRLTAIDTFRGLAILEVVLHHVTGMSLRHAEAGSDLHVALALLNRTLHFAVPAFLFMTAVVLTRSALNRFSWGSYYRTRALKSLLPYVLWTVLYVIFKVVTNQNPSGVLTDPERWQLWLQYGKGYFHLYFLLIALQFYLVLPFLLPLVRRRWSLPWTLAAAFGLQLIVYVLNREVLHFRFPGTMAVWYIPAITLGMYFGANYAQFEDFWRRWRTVIFAACGLALAAYLPQAYAVLMKQPVSSPLYSAAHWAYTTVMAVGLFGVAHSLQRAPSWLRDPLARVGSVSLQIYLLHPALLFFLNRAGYPGEPVAFLLVMLAYAATALTLPFVIARALEGRRLSVWLFGR